MNGSPRILIVKTSSLGDLFHVLPAVHLLKYGLGAKIDWVVNSEYASLLHFFTDVSRVIPFPRRNLRREWRAFRESLRESEYDLILDMQGLLKSALICRNARRKKVSAFSGQPGWPGGSDRALLAGPSFRREGAGLFYDLVSGPKNKARHAVQENLDMVRLFGLADEPVDFPADFPEYVLEGDAKKVVFAPCSRHEAKNWPPEYFAELGALLVKECDARIFLVGGPGDAAVCDFIASKIGSAAENLAGKTSLVELGGVLRAADLAVTVDSGPMHMGAAAGCRVLALFGPTDPLRVGPYGDRHRVLRGKVSSKAVRRSGNYSRRDLESIRSLSVKEVFEAATEML